MNYKNISDKEYFSIRAISSSALKELAKSEAHFHKYKTTSVKQTDAMAFGTASHILLLQSKEEFERRVVVNPFTDMRLKGAKEGLEQFKSTLHTDAIVLKQDDYNRALEANRVFNSHDESLRILNGCIIKEQSLEATIEGVCSFTVDCKIKPDGLGDGYMIDYKTCQDASPRAFLRTVYDRGYHIQAAFYMMIHNLTQSDKITDFYLLAQESEYPYSCQPYKLKQERLAEGWDMCLKAFKNFEGYMNKEDKTKLNFYSEGVLEL